MTNIPQGTRRPAGCCLDPHIVTFEAKLRENNYKPGTIKTYRMVVRRLASFMEAGGIAPEQLTADLAARLVRGEERRRREPNKCQNIARRFAAHLIDLGVAPAPVPTPQQIAREALFADYEAYLVKQRGLSPRSYARKLVTATSGGAFDLLDPVLERHSVDDIGELV